MGIGLTFTLQGAWMVLPFAGLEMLVLAIALHRVGRKTRRYQVVFIHPERVDVLHRDGRRQQVVTFQRAWTRTEVLTDAYRRGSRLYVHSHGTGVELGAFLNESEREALAHELRRLLATGSRSAST